MGNTGEENSKLQRIVSDAIYLRNVIHCAVKTARQEGSAAFYKGFTASCMRIVSWNIMLWMSYEQLKKGVNMFYANKD